MSKANVIRYRTKGPREAEENVRLIEAVFAQLNETRPEGLRYSAFRMADGLSFMHVVVTDGDALANLPAFKEFQQDIADRLDGPPEFTETVHIGGYHS